MNQRDITSQVAEDMTRVLDYLSRVVGAVETNSPAYLHEKLAGLSAAVRQVHVRLSRRAVPVGGPEQLVLDEAKWFDPVRLRALIAQEARHYAAGRALYPVGGSPEAAARRAALESAATDLRFGGAVDVPPAVADAVAGWLLARAEREVSR